MSLRSNQTWIWQRGLVEVISIAAEIKKAEQWMPFQFLDFQDEWLDSTFRACIEKAKPKMKVYTQCTYTILEFTVDEDLLRKELEKKDIHANEAVMIAMDALKRFGSIRIAH